MLLFLPLDFQTCESWLWEKQYRISVSDQSVASQLVLLLNLQKTFHFVTQQLQDDGENDKISEFPKHESIVLFTVK